MMAGFSDVKVHNEIELCELEHPEQMEKIKKALLRESVSFYIIWRRCGLFHRWFGKGHDTAILCVNEGQTETAAHCIEELEKAGQAQVHYINRRVEKIFF